MGENEGQSDLAGALREFDRVAANLDKLQTVIDRLDGTLADSSGSSRQQREELIRSFCYIADHVPGIDGYRIEAVPMTHDEIALAHIDANDVGEPSAIVAVEQEIEGPRSQLAEYRFRFERQRRALVRGRADEVVQRIDSLLDQVEVSEFQGSWRSEDNWGALQSLVSELDRLVGAVVPGRARWGDLRRHLHLGVATFGRRSRIWGRAVAGPVGHGSPSTRRSPLRGRRLAS